jgi:hypothetical protein
VSKKGEPFQFPPDLPPVPDYLTASDRALFIRIVNEMADAGVQMRPAHCLIIEVLTIHLGIIRQARAENRTETDAEAQKLREQIIAEQWARAVAAGKECLLSEEDLKRVLWEQ